MTNRLIAAAIALPLLALPVHAEKLVQVVIDHSGVLHDEQDPLGKSSFNSFLESFLADLARANRRDRNSTRVVLISAVEPPHIIWSGTAANFYREGIREGAVANLVTAQPIGCNNLVDALAEISANISVSQPDESVVHVITSGVHSGPDCDDLTQQAYIELIESTDPAVVENLERIATEVGGLSVHFLTSAQRRAMISTMDWQGTGISLFAQGEESGL